MHLDFKPQALETSSHHTRPPSSASRTEKLDKMASLIRPTLLRQACAAQRLAPTARPFANIRPSTLAFGNSTYQMTAARVAAFHATTTRQILPPLPRTF